MNCTKPKKNYGFFLLFLFFTVTIPCQAMQKDFAEIIEAVKPWVAKKEEASQLMQESVDLQQAKKVIEASRLTAIFDAHDARVTLYQALKCYSITYDLFLLCIETIGTNCSDDVFMDDISVIENVEHNDKKKCSLQ